MFLFHFNSVLLFKYTAVGILQRSSQCFDEGGDVTRVDCSPSQPNAVLSNPSCSECTCGLVLVKPFHYQHHTVKWLVIHQYIRKLMEVIVRSHNKVSVNSICLLHFYYYYHYFFRKCNINIAHRDKITIFQSLKLQMNCFWFHFQSL